MTDNILDWLDLSSCRFPDKTAFADATHFVSFGQLAQRTRQAATFIAQHAESRQPIALFCDKTVDAVSAMFGAVRAGCFYCVLDTRQPDLRLADMVSTLQPALVLCDAANIERGREAFESLGLTVALLEEAIAHEVDGAVIEARRAQANSCDPLYLNFTSGSTGTPKGVTVGHRSVLHFIPHFADIFDFTEDDVIANQAPLDFDVSVKDLYTGIYTGATVHLVPREYFSIPTQLMDFLCERQVTSLTWAVGALCFITTMGGFDYRVPDTIKKVLFSGEVMPPKHLKRWMERLPHATFVNLYGPTEITCNCTYHVVTEADDLDKPLPAGIPFPDEKVFLLDDGKLVSEPGAEGEICVGGITLALGYYNAPERTAEAFTQNPLTLAWPETIYHTGDMGFWDEDGLLRFCGRRDHQIKHLGQRIELGEIEYAACAVEGVDRACCLYDDAKKRIVLFYSGTPDSKQVKGALKLALPNHMVPNRLRQVEQMPLTKNGKIDRTALKASML